MNKLIALVIITFVFIVGCNENPVNTFSSGTDAITDAVTESNLQPVEISTDLLTTDNVDRQRMHNDFLYISFGGIEYPAGAVFYMDNNGHLHSDIPSNAENIRVTRANGDSIIVKFEYLGHHVVLPAYLIKIKYNQLPLRDSLHAFNGLGIVKERKLAYVYNEQVKKIQIFDLRDKIVEKLSCQRVGNVVFIPFSRELRPNEVVPDPWQSNIHVYMDRMANLESYLPIIY